MKTLATRMLLAGLGVLVSFATSALADELGYSDVEQRLATLEARANAQPAVQPAAYLASVSGGFGYDDCGSDCCGEADCGCDDCCGDACCEDSCCEESCCEDACCSECGGCGGGQYYAEYQSLWLRTHVTEDWQGKLSERYDYSPRIILGYEDCCGTGGRVRYWHYGEDLRIVDPAVIRLELDVVDLEATNRIHFRGTDLWLAGGFRYAHWELIDDEDVGVDIDAIGLTAAADVRTALCGSCKSQWSYVYGGRLSLLGGNWHGDNNIIDTVVDPAVRDDSIFVTELYAGFEYLCCTSRCDLFARLTFEMQNWRSDVLGEPGIAGRDPDGFPFGIGANSVGSTNSINFVGPSVSVGGRF